MLDAECGGCMNIINGKKKKMLNINIYIHIEFMMIDENWNLYPSGELRIMYWGGCA